MALDIGISKATDKKGNIVAYMQGATFSSAELRKIRAPYRYEIWSRRGYEPVAILHAKSDAIAKEFANSKFDMKGLHLEKINRSTRRVK